MADAFVDGRDYGVVCEECVRGGPEKIRKRMIKRAESLRRRAASLESLASQAIIDCATWADWEELERTLLADLNGV